MRRAFRATIPAPALPGSGSDGRRPGCRPLSPSSRGSRCASWYSRGCAILRSMATDRDQRLRALEAARLYFVCEGLPGGRDPGPLLDAALRGGADIVQLREKSPRSSRGADRSRRPLPPRGRRARGAVHPQRPARPGRRLRSRRRPRGPGGHARGRGASGWPGPRRWSGSRPIPASRSRRPARPPARTVPTRSASARCGRRRPSEGRPGTGLGLIEYAAGEATIPWFAIGGIDTRNVSSVVAAGAERIVVVRAIRDAEDPGGRRAPPARSARGRRRGCRADGQPRAQARGALQAQGAVGRAAGPDRCPLRGEEPGRTRGPRAAAGGRAPAGRHGWRR